MSGRRSWRIASASALGTSHAKLGMPCQDAHFVKVLTDKDGDDVLVVAVSDGAGSAARAEIGAWLTCSTIAEAAEAHLIEGGKVSDIRLDVARSWVGAIQRVIRLRAEDDNSVPRDYACTMLVAVVGEDSAVVLQIGDGAIVVSDDDGWCWVHWPQHGEFANTTNFVTEPQAEVNLAFDHCQCKIDEVAVFSDGIERLVLHEATKTVFAPFFDRMFPAVRANENEGIDAKLSEALAKYLTSSIIDEKTDDDKTLVLGTRRTPLKPEPDLQPAEVYVKDF